MKTKKLNVIFAMMLAFIFLSASNMAMAQCQHQQQQKENPGTSAGQKCGLGFIKDLTPEQEKQITTLKLKMQKETLPIKNQIDEKKAHLKTVSSGDNVDVTAVNKTIDEIYSLKADMAKKREAFRQDVRKLLNDEQKLAFDLHHAKFGDGEKGKGPKQNPGYGHGSGTGCGMGQGYGPGKGCCGQKPDAGQQHQNCPHQSK